ncbi:hypothetical protein [Agrobacterium sp. RS6]|uniref:hypothetical protein n=1 Tax=Agrobacterium sp. RS6 TaxID=2489001 RepID=UPI000FDE583E|nr:hypothetical protein [Agrobacterium sp. RS6]
MAELHIFITLASALEAVESDELHMTIGEERYTLSRARLLLDVIADGAVVISRTLLQFLGLNYKSGNAVLSQMQWYGDDLKMTDLNLPAVTAAQATSGLSLGQARADALFRLCLDAGNKISAHFTTKSATTQNASITELKDAFGLVIELVNREVYSALGRPEVKFCPGSRHGYVAKNDETATH